jgi:hypothetical protein
LNEVAPVVCSVLIAGNMAPMSEPSFTLLLSDGDVELTTTVGLLVAINEQVAWDVGSTPLMKTGEERQVTVKITNTGNTVLQRQLLLDVPSGWAASVDGNDVVDLALGESALLRINIRADTPGAASLGFELAQSPSSSSTFAITLQSEGEPIGTSGSSGLSTTVAVALFGAILLVAFAALGVQAMRSRDEKGATNFGTPLPPLPGGAPALPPSAPVVQPSSPVAVAATQPSGGHVAATPPPVCWGCRQAIITSALGCPSCGARYHGGAAGGCAASLTVCVNCQASAEHFVQA